MQKAMRWGILGTGQVARDFAEGLQCLPDATLAAVASRAAASAEQFARQWSVERWCQGYEKLATDPEVDIVYVATPNHLHRDHCLLALQGGKAVLCEKPFALNADQAKEVIDEARRRRLFCMEAMWMRFVPALAKLRELLDSGTIGELRMLFADLGFPAPAGNERFFDPAMGGGAWLDLGVYPLSLAFLLLGTPAQVVSRAIIGVTGVDDDSTALLSYPRGTLAVLSASLKAHLPGEALLVGTRGQIRVHAPLYCPQRLSVQVFGDAPPASSSGKPGQWRRRLKRIAWLRSLYTRMEGPLRYLLRRGPRSIYAPIQGNGYHYEAAEAMRCVRAGLAESPLMPLDETLRIMQCVDTIRAQWATG